MRLSGWVYLLGLEIRSRPGRWTVLLASGTLTLCLVFVCLNSFIYLRGEVQPHLETLFPPTRLIVRGPESNLFLLNVPGRRLDDESLRAVRAIDGVEVVHPQAMARFPVSAEITIGSMDIGFATDVVLMGVPAALVAHELPNPDAFRPAAAGEPVPMAASAYFLDIYNVGIAEGNRLPRLSRAAVLGRQLDLWLGESSVGLASNSVVRTQRARLVGLVDNPQLIGLIAPLETVLEWNAEFRGDAQPVYEAFHVDVTDVRALPQVEEELAGMGLRITRLTDDYQRWLGMVRGAQGAVLGFGAVAFVLAILGIGATVGMSLRSRRPVWGLHRAMGMTPGQAMGLIALDALVLAAISALAGSAIAAGCMAVASNVFGELLGSITSLPGNPLAVAPSTWVITAVAGIALFLVPAMGSAMACVRRGPLELIGEREL